MDTATLNLIWSDGLMDGLASAGIRRLVISPGSRSTPLVLAVNRHPNLHSWQHPDERSAAFFALGMATHEHKPVALIATSGSAPAHWLPAVIEANRSGIPLILLSADRPPELQHCGANQTVDQTHLFGSQIRAYYDAGTPVDDPQALEWIRSLGIQAAHRACWPEPGPVHINLPFREPLIPSTWPEPPVTGPCVPIADNLTLPDGLQIQRICRLLKRGRGLIICGPGAFEDVFPEAVTALARQLNCPLLADPLSPLRFGPHDHSHIISRYDSMLRGNDFSSGAGLDWVLRFGAAPVSKALLDYLARRKPPLVLCAPRGDWPDTLHQVAEMVRTSPSLLCTALTDSELTLGPADWLDKFTSAETAIDRLTLPEADRPFEAAIIKQLIAALPEGASLFSGNSLPIRQLDLWSGQGEKTLRILANRGASGIDGNISSLMGLAAAASGPIVGLLGDLAFFHDMNGLLFAKDLNGVIVLLNNNGGGIFGHLPQASLKQFEEQWLMPTNLDFAQAARLFSLQYQRVERQSQFGPALEAGLKSRGMSLIEVMLDREASLIRHKQYLKASENC